MRAAVMAGSRQHYAVSDGAQRISVWHIEQAEENEYLCAAGHAVG